MSFEPEDFMQSLNLLVSGMDSIAKSNLAKETAVLQSDTALRMQQLKIEADSVNTANKTSLGELNKQLEYQQKELPFLTKQLKDHNLNYQDMLDLGELNQTLEGNKLWKSLNQEKRDNLMTWGETTMNIGDNIVNKQNAIEINSAKIRQYNERINSALDGADRASNTAIDLNNDGYKSLDEYNQAYNKDYTMQGVMTGLDNIAADDGKTIFDKDMVEGLVSQEINDPNFKAEAAGFKSVMPTYDEDLDSQRKRLLLDKEQAVGVDKVILDHADNLAKAGAYEDASKKYAEIGIILSPDEILANRLLGKKGTGTTNTSGLSDDDILKNFQKNTGEIIRQSGAAVTETYGSFNDDRVYNISKLGESGAKITDKASAISYTTMPAENILSWISKGGSGVNLYEWVDQDSKFAKKEQDGVKFEGYKKNELQGYTDKRDYLLDFVKNNVSTEFGGGQTEKLHESGFSNDFVNTVDWSNVPFKGGVNNKNLNELKHNIRFFLEGDKLVNEFEANEISTNSEMDTDLLPGMEDAPIVNQNEVIDSTNTDGLYKEGPEDSSKIMTSLANISKDSTLSRLKKESNLAGSDTIINSEDSIKYFNKLKNSKSLTSFYKNLEVEDVESTMNRDWKKFSNRNAKSLIVNNVPIDWVGAKEQKEMLLGYNQFNASLNAIGEDKKTEVLKTLDLINPNKDNTTLLNPLMSASYLEDNTSRNNNTPYTESEKIDSPQYLFEQSGVRTGALKKVNMTEDEKMTNNLNPISQPKPEMVKDFKQKYPNAEMGSNTPNVSYEMDIKDGRGMKTYNWNEGPMFTESKLTKEDDSKKIVKVLEEGGLNKEEAKKINKFVIENSLETNSMEAAVDAYSNMSSSYKKKVSLKEWIAIQMNVGIKKYKYDFPKFTI